MIDVHCHIIPGIDDGSKDFESSIAQLLRMDKGGVTHAFLTSHYFKGHYEYEKDEYLQKLEALKAALKERDAKITLLPGFEVFLSPGILKDIEEKELFMGSSKYILIETELNGLPDDFYTMAFELLRAGYKPILAHAERYVSIMKNPKKARSLMERNIYIQVNSGSLMGQYGEKVRQTAWILVDNGWAHVIGSDDHTRGHYRSYFDALTKIEDRIDDHTAHLLSQKHPQMILDDEAMPYHYVYVEHPSGRSSSKRRGLFGK